MIGIPSLLGGGYSLDKDFFNDPPQGRFANRPYLIFETGIRRHGNPLERPSYAPLKYSSSSGRAFQFGLVGHSLWRESLSPP